MIAETCSELGVDLMQGYYFARPAATMVTTADSLVSLSRYVKQSMSHDTAVLSEEGLFKKIE